MYEKQMDHQKELENFRGAVLHEFELLRGGVEYQAQSMHRIATNQSSVSHLAKRASPAIEKQVAKEPLDDAHWTPPAQCAAFAPAPPNETPGYLHYDEC